MALAPKLELRQGQQLVMTPQLQQAIRLLQLSRLELIEEVGRELDNNPVLWREVVRGFSLQGIYVAVFLGAAWANFSSKDITS